MPKINNHFIKQFWQVGAMSKYTLILYPALATWKPVHVQRRKWSIPRIKRVIPSMSISQNKKKSSSFEQTLIFRRIAQELPVWKKTLQNIVSFQTIHLDKTKVTDNQKSII